MCRVVVYSLLLLIVGNSYAFAPAQQLKGASPSGSKFPFKKSAVSSKTALFMSTSPEDKVAELKAAAAKAREDAERLSAELKQSKEVEEKAAPKAESSSAAVAAPQQTAQVSADGTFYDDEMDSAPKKDGLSDNMKARLMKEASQGLDADSKQSNSILYISGFVALLVIVGGSGILY